jgi:hypothetical protein
VKQVPFVIPCHIAMQSTELPKALRPLSATELDAPADGVRSIADKRWNSLRRVQIAALPQRTSDAEKVRARGTLWNLFPSDLDLVLLEGRASAFHVKHLYGSLDKVSVSETPSDHPPYMTRRA